MRKEDYATLEQAFILLSEHLVKASKFASVTDDNTDQELLWNELKELCDDGKLVLDKLKKIEWKTKRFKENTKSLIIIMELQLEYEKTVYNAYIGKGTISKEEIDKFTNGLEEHFGLIYAFITEEAEYLGMQ